jgi:hypothetical protein
MIPHNEGIPNESFNLAVDTHWGFYALGTNANPSLKMHYCSACLQAVANLSRLLERANAFNTIPLVRPVHLRSIARGSEGAL